jgi:Domain of unknown function (DUF4402)
MSRFTKYLLVGSTAALALLPVGSAYAQETAGSPIQVTVSNAFTFTETQALNFGTIVAVNHTADTSVYAVDETGIVTAPTNPGNALMYEIVPAVEGTFTISGAAPSTVINVTLPATSVTLTCGACGGTPAEFTVDNFVTDAAGTVPNLTVTTDGAGAAAFAIGADLTTIASANAFGDGDYTAAYTITANY